MQLGRRFNLDKLETGLGYLFSSVISIAVALVISGIVLFYQGINPWAAYAALFNGAFVGMGNFSASLVRAIPLMLAGLGVAVAFKAGIFNIGAEGQLYLAAMASTWVGIAWTGLPFYLHLPLALLAGMAMGGLWAFIPGYLKIKKGFNEVITTILMNYIAVYFVNWSVKGILQDPQIITPQSAPVADAARLPRLIAGTELHGGLILAVLAAVLLYLILSRTDFGFQLRSVGLNPEAARTSGMNAGRILLVAMVASGALAGLAGSSEILGFQRILLENFSVNTGYDAIAVALLGRLNPIGVIFSALFFGALRNGATTMQIMMGIPATIIYVIQAVIILSVLGFSNYRFTLNFLRRRKVVADGGNRPNPRHS